MRLFLSSYRAGSHDKELLEFLGGISEVAVITNAKDYKTPNERKEKIEEIFAYYRSIGIEPTEIDLRPYFHKKGAEKLLRGYDFIWLAGGNAFLLRRALTYTGLDRWLSDKVHKNQIMYGGESAGAILAGPTLRGSEDKSTNEDHPNFIPKPYKKKVIWAGLGFVTYVPVPHYKSPDYGPSIDGYVAYLQKNQLPYKTMEEQQAIVINGDKEELLK